MNESFEILNPQQCIDLIENRLKEALMPVSLTIEDQSYLHNDHGDEHKGGHFHLDIVSSAFNGVAALERHRMIYSALGNAMGTHIHALSINAKTIEEESHQQEPEN